MIPASNVVVFDFETTGLSPNQGDRAIEIGAVRLRDGDVVEQFQALMNPGLRVSGEITQITGITNAMLRDQPSCAVVMRRFKGFIGDDPLIAHNASFDRRFLSAELDRLSLQADNPMACSMLLSRRLFQNAPNHRLGTLVTYRDLPNDGVFHRALADAQMTAHLWNDLIRQVEAHGQRAPSFSLMKRLEKTPKAHVRAFFKKNTRPV